MEKYNTPEKKSVIIREMLGYWYMVNIATLVALIVSSIASTIIIFAEDFNFRHITRNKIEFAILIFFFFALVTRICLYFYVIREDKRKCNAVIDGKFKVVSTTIDRIVAAPALSTKNDEGAYILHLTNGAEVVCEQSRFNTITDKSEIDLIYLDGYKYPICFFADGRIAYSRVKMAK